MSVNSMNFPDFLDFFRNF